MTTDPKMNFLTGEYEDITWRDYAVVGIVAAVLSTLIYLAWQTHTTNKRLDTHEAALSEMAGVIVKSGLVVPDKDGKPMVNEMLSEAWKQANQIRSYE